MAKRFRAVPAFLIAALLAGGPQARGKTLASLNPHSRELLLTSMAWMDRYWDERAGFLWSPEPKQPCRWAAARCHLVRETAWYAFGLLQRDQEGDRERASQALNALLEQQIDEPGQPWDATFYRSPEEPHVPPFPRMWTDYDPNWREFIGSAFALVLLESGERVPAELARRLQDSIRRAVDAESNEDRLKPTYTNIAIMYAFLRSYARPEWIEDGEKWAKAIYSGFREHNTFEEYNSPTYYGVDLYGLALWRVHGPTDPFRKMGSEMESALWRDIAAYYHAGLKNLAGPYDRAYGMDMRRYVSLTGLWLATVLEKQSAPLPDPNGSLEHAADYMYAPVFATLGTRIPVDTMQHFRSFQGERQIRRVITPRRIATAWIGPDLMLGAETTEKTREAGMIEHQFRPVTAHWKIPGGDIGWIELLRSPRLDARVERNTFFVSCVGDSVFRISAPRLDAKTVRRNLWKLPGLTVQVKTDARELNVSSASGHIDLLYKEATSFELHLSNTASE